MLRDLFGSILFLSLQQKIDMKEVLLSLLSSILLSLCHVNRLKQTTPKVKLSYEKESRIPNDTLSKVDATAIDEIFFLHLQKTIPGTFGSLSSYPFIRICAEKAN